MLTFDPFTPAAAPLDKTASRRYDDERDFIIFNQEHELFQPYNLFVMDLLEFTDKQLVDRIRRIVS